MTKPTCEDALVVKKRDLNNDYFSLVLAPFSQAKAIKPGQFVHIRLPSTDIYFRRAFSVASINPAKKEVEIIFKVFGRGTKILGKMRKGDSLDLLGPLGVPFSIPDKNVKAVIVAGGVGFPPLMFLAEKMIEKGHSPKLIEFFYGGRSKLELVKLRRLKKMGIQLHLCTDEGSAGNKGHVTGPVEQFLKKHLKEKIKLFGCGPEKMLKAVDELGLKYEVKGELALEALMPCGVGICLGCVVHLKAGGYARVCCDGPVFEIGVVNIAS